MAGLRERLACCAALTALCASALFGVSATGERAAQAPADECIPGTTCGGMPSSAGEYAAMCELELGVAPIVDCGAGVLIPITVDGIEVFEDPGLHECDNASPQIGDCMPGSSLQRYGGRNVSNGKMFALVDFAGAQMTADYAARRQRNEPVVEITQATGTSETHPVLSPNDEFADFELFPELLTANRAIGGDGPRPGVVRVDGLVPGSYAREALVNGVRMQAERGFNPFQFGFVGATDFHSGTSAVEENNMTSMSGDAVDATLEERLVTNTWSRLPFVARSAAGLTAAWANENTRDELYAAFRRRETYATTGTRITVRFFGGWDYAADVLDGDDWVAQGYAGGVPMGGVLRGAEGEAPTFVIRAAKDPVAANLDRIQVIKGWSAGGETFERIHDVALSDGRRVGPTGKAPPVGNTVDVMRATYTNDIGAASLEAVWRDPDFDPDVHAVYYVRVIEIPTPRWSTYDTAAAGLPPRGDVMPTLQERAYTSPIWYMPDN